jgi:hypothetical protein
MVDDGLKNTRQRGAAVIGHHRISEIGSPGARDICLTAADKYQLVPTTSHFSRPPGIQYTK